MSVSPLTGSKQSIAGQGVVSQGSCIIPINAPPAGSYYTGTITIYDSPAGANWNVVINGLVTDVIIGINSCQNVQILTGDVLTLTTSGLIGQNGNTIHATFVAIETPVDTTELMVPGHDSVTSLLSLSPGLTVINSPAPPVGSDFNINFLTTGYLRSFIAKFVTSAAVATRSVLVRLIAPGNNIVWEMPAPITQTAGQGIVYEAFPGCQWLEATIAAQVPCALMTLPPNILVGVGWFLQTSTANIDVGDQWSLPVATIGLT